MVTADTLNHDAENSRFTPAPRSARGLPWRPVDDIAGQGVDIFRKTPAGPLWTCREGPIAPVPEAFREMPVQTK